MTPSPPADGGRPPLDQGRIARALGASSTRRLVAPPAFGPDPALVQAYLDGKAGAGVDPYPAGPPPLVVAVVEVALTHDPDATPGGAAGAGRDVLAVDDWAAMEAELVRRAGDTARDAVRKLAARLTAREEAP